MPPKPKFTREEIVAAALSLLREQGESALTAREMIKLTVLETCPETPREMAAALAAATGAEVVQVVGRKVTLYRKNPEKTILDLR